MTRSNEVLVDGIPIEAPVGGTVAVSDCPSCSDLVGTPSNFEYR